MNFYPQTISPPTYSSLDKFLPEHFPLLHIFLSYAILTNFVYKIFFQI